MHRITLALAITLAGCVESPRDPTDYFPDVGPGVHVDYYDLGDGIAPDTVHFVALVGEWNGVDTLFYHLSDRGDLIEESWWISDNVEAAIAYDPLDDLELLWRAWMAGDTAELVWTP